PGAFNFMISHTHPLLYKQAEAQRRSVYFLLRNGKRKVVRGCVTQNWYNRSDRPSRCPVAPGELPKQESHVRKAEPHTPANRRAAVAHTRSGIDHAPGVDPVALPPLWQRRPGIGVSDRLQRQIPPASACAARAETGPDLASAAPLPPPDQGECPGVPQLWCGL